MLDAIEFTHAPAGPNESLAAVGPRLAAAVEKKLHGGLSARLAALEALSDALLRAGSTSRFGPGAAFLAGFLRRTNLEHLLQREIPDCHAFDQFVAAGERKSLRILPRGVVCHWIAGNVPLLGAFSWALSALVGNANIVRLSSRQDDLLSPLLAMLANQSETGRQMAEKTVVVRFERENRIAHEEMSRLADVRITWGGQEAIETVRSLPARWDCQDILLGPRVSCAIVDPAEASDRQLDRLVTDIAYFDQQACSSPQRVFVRGKRGETDFGACVERLAERFDHQSTKLTRHPLGFSDTYQIALDRARVLLDGGDLKRDRHTQWTIAVVDEPHAEVVCANRFVQLVPYQQLQSVYPNLPRNIQTVVTLLSQKEMLEFTEGASHYGVCRFPRPGQGNFFENPWDGLALVSRLTHWVTRSEPR